MIKHYFPGIDLKEIDDDEFATLMCDAEWLHNEKQQQVLLGSMGGTSPK